jgi:hypothetical protein
VSAGGDMTGLPTANDFCIYTSSQGTYGALIIGPTSGFVQINNGKIWMAGVSGSSNIAFYLSLGQDSTQKPGTNTWNTGSDIRLKRNVRPFTEGLETILKVEPIRFEYNGRMRYPEGLQCVGIDAGAHKDILPDCVSTFRDKLDGEDSPEEDVFSFNSHALTFMLINAVKELAERLQRLESQTIH